MRFSIPVLIAGLLLLAPRSAAQMRTTEEIVFFSTDQVELAGTFYASSRGAAAPCALLLHKVGGSRKDEGWKQLAEALQNKGYAVLSFDFRGHGESTTVFSDFWHYPAHRGIKGAATLSATLNSEDFTRASQIATLVNDIAAAKHVLDVKSHKGLCDSSTVVVVGDSSGAALGALWLAAEWQRGRVARDGTGRLVKVGLEGHDVACAVWLSLTPVLYGRQTVPVHNWLSATVQERVPMGFLYGANDAKASEYANAVYDKFKQASDAKLNKLSGIRGIAGTGRSGSGLVADASQKVNDLILSYLDQVLKGRKKVIRARPDPEVAPPVIAVENFGVR